jgi:hypothetical protein
MLRLRSAESVKAALQLGPIPEHIVDYGRYMNRISRTPTPRVLLKAYLITISSIRRRSQWASSIRKHWPELPYEGEVKLRPEDVFARMLGTMEGQQYLDVVTEAAEHGLSALDTPDEAAAMVDAAHRIVTMYRGFGLVGFEPGSPELKPLTHTNAEMFALFMHAPEIVRRHKDIIQHLHSDSVEEWLRFITLSGRFHFSIDGTREGKIISGIDLAKAGFFAAMLGRGDIPVGDARELATWIADATKRKSIAKNEGESMFDFVQKLADRFDELDLPCPEDVRQHYRYLVHHYIWDAAEKTETAHDEIKQAMVFYGELK